MKKLDYLKQAIQNKLYKKRAWIISAFSITKPKDTNESSLTTWQLIPQPWGYSYLTPEGVLEKIEDATPNAPLFHFLDPITIDSSWAENASGTIQTTIGNLLFNHISIISSFGSKFPFISGKVSIEEIENTVAVKLLDTPATEAKRSTTDFHVDEYIKFVDSLQFLATLAQLTTVCATKKVITAPPGIKEFKQNLLAKYQGTLHNPVELSKFEAELKAYDSQYLKDDPADGKFVSGKIKDIARKKMFLALGGEGGFDDGFTVTPVINSLEEGWPTDPEQFTAMMNGLRWGSYSRGAETVKGGVSAKYLLRAANNFEIKDTDCGSKLGIRRQFDSKNIDNLVGRTVIDGTKTTLVENKEQAQNYVDRKIIVRSPMYCKLDGDNICKVCAGQRLFQYPTGVTIPLTEISAIILTASLKMMHGSVLATEKLDMQRAFS